MDIKKLLEYINAIAVLMPFLAKPVKNLTNLLLAKTETSGDIINQRFLENEDLKKKKSETKPPSLKNDSSSSEESFVVKPDLNKDTVPTKNTNEKEVDFHNSTAISSQEITLRQIEQDFQDGRERKLKQLKNIQTQESVTFKCMLIFSFSTLVFLGWGDYIIFHQGLNIIGILIQFIGLVGGAGTLILIQLREGLKAKADNIEREQNRQTKYLRAIQTALSLTGSEREIQLAETAKWLREMESDNN